MNEVTVLSLSISINEFKNIYQFRLMNLKIFEG